MSDIPERLLEEARGFGFGPNLATTVARALLAAERRGAEEMREALIAKLEFPYMRQGESRETFKLRFREADRIRALPLPGDDQ